MDTPGTLGAALLDAVILLASGDAALLAVLGRTLEVSLAALGIATAVGLPTGAVLGLARGLPARGTVRALIYTGMGLPPVVVGLFVYLLLSRAGPLGDLGWLFSVKAMVLAQTILSVPLVVGLTMAALEGVDPELGPQLAALGATPVQVARTTLREARSGVLAAIAAAFGAAISEVGAVMLVGGNIEGQTRVLTTAILLETRRGQFSLACALGLLLLALTFTLNFALLRAGEGRTLPRAD